MYGLSALARWYVSLDIMQSPFVRSVRKRCRIVSETPSVVAMMFWLSCSRLTWGTSDSPIEADTMAKPALATTANAATYLIRLFGFRETAFPMNNLLS